MKAASTPELGLYPASDPKPATVLIEDGGTGVRILTINRPDRRNAMDHATYLALVDAIVEADEDAGVHVIVITGADGTFTSGNDIADFRRVPPPEPRGGMLLFRTLIAARKPIIAAVEGHAVGIGATMLLHCDMAYAGEGSKFRLPFTALGLSPEGASTYLLPRLAGDKRAAELLFLGEVFGAAEATAAGLVNRVVPHGTALAVALDKATTLAQLPASSVQATKALLRGSRHDQVLTAIDDENGVFSERLMSDEAQAIFARFAKKS